MAFAGEESKENQVGVRKPEGSDKKKVFPLAPEYNEVVASSHVRKRAPTGWPKSQTGQSEGEKKERRIQWNCFPERRLNRNQVRFLDLVGNGSRGSGVCLRTGDGGYERCRVEALTPFFFELTWFIWREGRGNVNTLIPHYAMRVGFHVPYVSS